MEALGRGMELPKSAESGNLSLNKAIIWWISVNITARMEEYYGCIVPSAILFLKLARAVFLELMARSRSTIGLMPC